LPPQPAASAKQIEPTEQSKRAVRIANTSWTWAVYMSERALAKVNAIGRALTQREAHPALRGYFSPLLLS
jgi:hypothetical protein